MAKIRESTTRWLRAFAWSGKVRTYEEFILTGYEVVVLESTTETVTIATHNLARTFVKELTWEEFVRTCVLRCDTTAEYQALQLRNTMRTIATKADKDTALRIERFLDNPPVLSELPVVKKVLGQTTLVRADPQRRTCLELTRDNETVTYLPLTDTPLEIASMSVGDFDEWYSLRLDDYPVEKAALVYAQFAQYLGATKEAMRELAKLTNVSQKEFEMAVEQVPEVSGKAGPLKAKPVSLTKKAVPPSEAKPVAKKTVSAPAAKKDAPVAKKIADAEKKATAPAKKATAPAKKAAEPAKKAVVKQSPVAKNTREREAPSASSRFQELIMEGKLTDEEIFSKVQQEFKLADNKRTYVAWYRNYLRKQGKNPPASKKA